MAENLVAVFSIGFYTHVREGFFGVKRTLPVLRTLIFTQTRLVVGEVVRPTDIDPKIKRHTPAYTAALVKFANEKAAFLVDSGSLDSLLQTSDSIAVEYAEIKRIKDGSLLLPKLEVDLNDHTVIRFTAMEKEGFKASLAALKKAMPDRIR